MSESPENVRHAAELVGCPDCPADVVATEIADGIWRVTVAHEPTCPIYRALVTGRTA